MAFPTSPATYCPCCGAELVRMGEDFIDVCRTCGIMEGSGLPEPPREEGR